MGLLQVSHVFGAREILYHAAVSGARCKTVGFNRWMVTKSVRVASIPNAGKLTTPEFDRNDPVIRAALAARRVGDTWDMALRGGQPRSGQFELEIARIPDYMFAPNEDRARGVLDYENWDTVDRGINVTADRIQVETSQDYELWVPLHRTFYASDEVRLSGESEIENHYALYLDDMGL